MKLKNLFTIVLSTALLIACGGGGGDSSPVVSAKTFDLKAIYANYLNSSYAYKISISGTVSGLSVAGSGNVTLGTLQTTQFEEKTALMKTSVITGTISAEGRSIPYSGSSQGYYDTNYNPLGASSSNYLVVNSYTAMPTAAKVNDSGLWMNLTTYSSSAKSYSTGTRSVSYALSADTETTAILTLIYTDKDTSGSITSTIADKYRISITNSVTPLSEAMSAAGNSVLFTFL